ncbi:MAG: hypothetical protein ACMUJK_02900 [Rhodobacterales bacterium]
MTAIAKVDQLITSLQNIRATLAADNGVVDEGQFDVLFNDALRNSSETPTAIVNASAASTVEDTETSSFDDFMAMDLVGADPDQSHHTIPNMKEFMDITGVSFADASEILYGVIGSNGDYRDWDAIMATDNPLDAARAATAQQFNSNLPYELRGDESFGTSEFVEVLASKTLTEEATLGQQGNFAIRATGESSYLTTVSSSGLLLRDAGSSKEQIERTAWLFGFSTVGLGSLADKAQTAALKDALDSFA